VPPDAVPGAFAGVAEPELLQGLEAYFAGKLDAGWSPGRTAFGRVLALFPEDARRSRLGARWEARSVDALKRLAAYTPLLRGGDAERGRAAFEKATCIACHRVGGQGGRIGPDLSRIGAIRAGGDLLESILYPSSSFAQGYEPYRLTRRDGEEVLGTLASQGPEGIVLRDAAGESRRVPTGDIAALERLENSAMPEGLEQLLGREELADLLAFLGSLR
jgi:putative heme-binding domain-containing protein